MSCQQFSNFVQVSDGRAQTRNIAIHVGMRFARVAPGWHDNCVVCCRQPAA